MEMLMETLNINNNPNVLDFFNFLYDNADVFKGYIHFKNIDPGKGIVDYFTVKNKIYLDKTITEYKGKNDMYFTPNTSFLNKSINKTSIKQARCFVIDLDVKNTKYEKNEAIQELIRLEMEEVIPMVSSIVDSGNGLHCYWKIKSIPGTKEMMFIWNKFEKFLCNKLNYLGSDPKATSVCNLYRLPGTINTKGYNKKECKCIYINYNAVYSIDELSRRYIPFKKKKRKNKWDDKKEVQDNKIVPIHVKSKKSLKYLNHYREIDLNKLLELRNYSIKGFRNAYFTIYISNLFYKNYNNETSIDSSILNKALEVNNGLIEPLKEKEVERVYRSILSAYNSSKKGLENVYSYTNKTIIDVLEISITEQEDLNTIISKEIKDERRNLKKRKERRNSQNNTSREQSKIDNIDTIKSLKNEGKTIKEIINITNLSKSYIYKLLSEESL